MRILLLAVLLTTLAAQPAWADDLFCVGKPECPGGTAKATLADAIASADGDADLDRIEIGPVTLAEQDLTAMMPVAIVGSGAATVIQAGDVTTAGHRVLRLSNTATTISDLTIRQTQTTTSVTAVGLELYGAQADRIVYEGSGTNISIGVAVYNLESRLRDSRVSLPRGAGATGIGVRIGDGTVENIDVDAPTGVQGGGSLRRARIHATREGIFAQGVLSVDGVLVGMTQAAPESAAYGAVARAVAGASEATSTLKLRHATMLGPGTPGSVALQVVSSVSGGGTALARVDARESVWRSFAENWERTASTGSGITSSTLSIDWGHFRGGGPAGSGPGSLAVCVERCVDVEPQFRDEAGFDLRLRGGSGLIDQGNPAATFASDSPIDVLGRARVMDGDANGTAIRDIGGVEYQGPPSLTAFTAAPASPLASEAVTLSATGVPSPEGPVERYVWDLDGNGSFETDTGVLSSMTRGFPTAGLLNLHVRVIAIDGGVAERTLPLTVRPRLALSGFKISRKRFKSKSKQSFSYTLNIPAAVSIAITRTVRGYRKGAKCVRKRVRGAKRCALTETVLTLKRASAAGAKKLSFKRKLAPGTYRPTVLARSADGQVASTKTVSFRVVR